MKIILILLGVFITAMIFALGIELLGEAGIWVGLIVSLGIAALGFYYTQKGDKARLIAWSILISVLASITLFIMTLQIISKTWEGF